MRPYRPSNGTEGDDFKARFCDRCEKFGTEDDTCKIWINVLFYDRDDPEYPKEWVEDDDDQYGETARCTSFVPKETKP